MHSTKHSYTYEQEESVVKCRMEVQKMKPLLLQWLQVVAQIEDQHVPADGLPHGGKKDALHWSGLFVCATSCRHAKIKAFNSIFCVTHTVLEFISVFHPALHHCASIWPSLSASNHTPPLFFILHILKRQRPDSALDKETYILQTDGWLAGSYVHNIPLWLAIEHHSVICGH